MKRTLKQVDDEKISTWTNHDEHEDKLFNFVPPLHIQRKRCVLDVVMDHVKSNYPERCEIVPDFKIVDVGCEKGAFFQFFQTELIALKNKFNTNYIGIDISEHTLMNETVESLTKFSMGNSSDLRSGSVSVKLLHENVLHPSVYLDRADVLVMIEVIEHIKLADVNNLLPHSIFGSICPKLAIITTPNADFNIVFGMKSRLQYRHWDHKFEWSRKEFVIWCDKVVSYYPEYDYHIEHIGTSIAHHTLGGGSQMAIFTRNISQPLSMNNTLLSLTKMVYEKESLFLPLSEYDVIKKYLAYQMSFWAVERHVFAFDESDDDSFDSMKESDPSLSDIESLNLGIIDFDENTGAEVFIVPLDVIERIMKKSFPKADINVERIVEECCRESIYFKFDEERRQIYYVISVVREEEEDEDEDAYMRRLTAQASVLSLCDDFQEADI